MQFGVAAAAHTDPKTITAATTAEKNARDMSDLTKGFELAYIGEPESLVRADKRLPAWLSFCKRRNNRAKEPKRVGISPTELKS
jgi:hypothetical protein